MRQLELDLGTASAKPKRGLTDLGHLRRVAISADVLRPAARPEALRAACLEYGLSPAGWRFLTRHGRAAYAAVEDAADGPEQLLFFLLTYIEAQAQSGVPGPTARGLGRRYLAQLGFATKADCPAAPRLLAVGDRHLRSLPRGGKRKAFVRGPWRDVLAWFRDTSPCIDKNQWKAGWPAVYRAFAQWRDRHPNGLAWRSLLGTTLLGDTLVAPLVTSTDLAVEGEQMHHCAGTYSRRCHNGDYRLFAVTREGERPLRTTVAITRAERGWKVDQVRGRFNADPDREALRVAAVIADRYGAAEGRLSDQRRGASEVAHG